MSDKKTILLGITSGIAAYKVLELIPLLQKKNFYVEVMMTGSATRMVDPHEIEKRTGKNVFCDLFPDNFTTKEIVASRHVDHIDLADRADVVVIVPATANIIGKLASGIADDFVTTTMLAVTCPVLICPSMNVHMWSHPAVVKNIAQLKHYGYEILEPADGPLACGYEGKGRLPEISTIAEEIRSLVNRSTLLSSKRVVVTAGGTQEKIDDVRYITNKSSGKMGAAIADACVESGAEVTILRSTTSISPRHSMNEHTFESSYELRSLLEHEVKSADIVFHVAAVSDFSIEEPVKGKLSSKHPLHLELTPQTKIIDSIKKWNPHIFLVAFKAEYGLSEEELLEKAKEKIRETHADVIVANDISKDDRGFGVDTNEVSVIFPTGRVVHIPFATKGEIAKKLISLLCHPELVSGSTDFLKAVDAETSSA